MCEANAKELAEKDDMNVTWDIWSNGDSVLEA